jgi:hypothetical protein
MSALIEPGFDAGAERVELSRWLGARAQTNWRVDD